jgi:hypothetical protein
VTNAIAKLITLSAINRKSFIALAPGGKIVKHFDSSPTKKPNKLEWQSLLIFASKAGDSF